MSGTNTRRNKKRAEKKNRKHEQKEQQAHRTKTKKANPKNKTRAVFALKLHPLFFNRQRKNKQEASVFLFATCRGTTRRFPPPRIESYEARRATFLRQAPGAMRRSDEGAPGRHREERPGATKARPAFPPATRGRGEIVLVCGGRHNDTKTHQNTPKSRARR